MKRAVLSTFVVVSFILYSLGVRHQDSEVRPVVSVPRQQSGQSNTSSSAFSSSTVPAATAYKDGTYTGSVADAFYGNVQVRATVSGGKIVRVDFLQYPNDRPTSVEINSQAMPLLQQEAIQAQSAHVDGVSGASDTSQAFIQSLSAALAQAS